MKKRKIVTKTIILALAGVILLSSCVSTTMIQSTPKGAKLYVNGESVGKTPYTYSDKRIIGSVNTVKLEKKGFETLNTNFTRDEEVDVGAVIGGFLLWVPFLWTMKYKPIHKYNLTPNTGKKQAAAKEEKKEQVQSKTDRLRELKQFVDEKLITQKEYEAAKKKILEEK